MANIVVVDDYPPILELLTAVCQAQGHEVRAFESSEAGMEMIRDWQPEVALLDRRLGGEDGLDLVQRVRTMSPQTRCVMVTACNDTQDIVQAMKRGAHNYVTKPFENADIINAVNEALASPNEEPLVRQKLVIVFPKQAA
ncbi:MAG: response regulator [Prosthecobacter sp.]|nr:response regulator [Prosthecobacter sp.]